MAFNIIISKCLAGSCPVIPVKEAIYIHAETSVLEYNDIVYIISRKYTYTSLCHDVDSCYNFNITYIRGIVCQRNYSTQEVQMYMHVAKNKFTCH